MKHEESPVVFQVVRYGLPLVVAVFYCTAALNFSYTPDSAYLPLQWVRGGEGISFPFVAGSGQMPLWLLLLKVGTALHLDALLTAKIFSLLFCSCSLLALYLVAVGVVRDRLMALCCVLVAALDPLLLQAGPSGSGVGLALALSLGALFFLLRGDDVLAALFAGLCSLLFWQAFFLFLLILLDIGFLEPAARRSRRLLMSVSAVTLIIGAPWIVFALARGSSPAPVLVPFGEFGTVTWPRVVLLVVCAVLAAAGIFLRSKGDPDEEETGRTGVILGGWVLWMAICGIFWEKDFWFLGAPAIVVGAFYGLRRLMTATSADQPAYGLVFLLSGVFLLINQFTFVKSVRPEMTEAVEEAQAVESVAFWARAHVASGATMQSEKVGLTGYVVGRAIDPLPAETAPNAEFVVSQRTALPGYDVVYRPTLSVLDSLSRGARVALYQRR